MNLITKSLYLNALQCPKLFWNKMHSPDVFDEIKKSDKARFREGEEVGLFAQEIYPRGISAYSENYFEGLLKTKEFVSQRQIIFEASFETENLFSRADILVPVGEFEWDLIEVKSSTRVKEVHLEDLAFQKYVYMKKGINIRKCFLMHVNNKYVKEGKINPEEFFSKTDLTQEIENIIEELPERIKKIREITIMKKTPEPKIGSFCNSPYECPLKKKCWSFLPDQNTLELYRDKTKAFELLNKGIMKLKDIPEEFNLNSKQNIQRKVAREGQDFVNHEQIEEFLEDLNYPLYYLDFETMNPAIPMYDGMRPYQRIGFQFSLHIQKEKRGELEHYSFLASGKKDPRENFLKALKKCLGEKGDILVYNDSFEKGVLQEHALAIEGFDEWLGKILPRIKDLIIPFRNFYFYSSKQKGLCSIKNILPVFSDLNYSEMEIGKGDVASLAFLAIAKGEVNEQEKEKIRKNLIEYCKLDTYSEVKIVEGLYDLVEKNK